MLGLQSRSLIPVIKVIVVLIGFESFILLPNYLLCPKGPSKTNNRTQHPCDTLKGTA